MSKAVLFTIDSKVYFFNTKTLEIGPKIISFYDYRNRVVYIETRFVAGICKSPKTKVIVL